VYARVDNVRLVGPASSDWSWFPPHLWTMALCDRCHAHLGWAFSKQQGAPPAFYGLIAERLRET
jgi:cereblon